MLAVVKQDRICSASAGPERRHKSRAPSSIPTPLLREENRASLEVASYVRCAQLETDQLHQHASVKIHSQNS